MGMGKLLGGGKRAPQCFAHVNSRILFTALLVVGLACNSVAADAPVEDVPGLPRVLLIGDSISMGYTAPARAAEGEGQCSPAADQLRSDERRSGRTGQMARRQKVGRDPFQLWPARREAPARGARHSPPDV